MHKTISCLSLALLVGLTSISCQKRGARFGSDFKNFRTGKSRDDGSNGRGMLLQNSAFIEPLVDETADHTEVLPTANDLKSIPVVKIAETSDEQQVNDGSPVAGQPTVPGTPLPTGVPNKGAPVPYPAPAPAPTSGLPSMFPFRKVCSDSRLQGYGYSLRSMNPADLKIMMYPIESQGQLQPFAVPGNPNLIQDVVNTGYMGLNLSQVPNGTYNLVLCNTRYPGCGETRFLQQHGQLADFQSELFNEYDTEYQRELRQRTTKFTDEYKSRERYHTILRDNILDQAQGVFGGAPRVVVQNGQVVFPATSYLVRDNGLFLLRSNTVASAYPARTAPEVVVMYDGNRNKAPVSAPATAPSYGWGSTVNDGGKGGPPGPPMPPPPVGGGGDGCDDTVSPLIVDLDNTGLNLSAPLDGVLFDIDGDGKAEKISWPRGSAAYFIALDLNSNGKIDDGKELFGNYTVGPDGQVAANGFDALAKYDSDKDGKITAKDPVFKKLILWLDANFDGKSDAKELKTLSALGISSLDLTYQTGMEEDRYGNQTRERSTLSLTNGKMRMVFDIWFRKI